MKQRTAATVFSFLLASLPSASRAHGGKVIREMPCPVDEPMGMVVDGDTIWLSDMTSRSVARIDKDTGQVQTRRQAPGVMPTGLAFQDDTLWVADRWLDRFTRWEVADGGELSPVPYYEAWAWGITYDRTHLWVVDARNSKLHQVDLVDGTTIRSFPAPASAPTGIAFDGRYLWVADHKTDELHMVSRRTGDVILAIPSPGPYPSALAADGASLWVADYQDRRLVQVELPGETPYVEDQPRHLRASYEVVYRAVGGGRVTHLVSYVAVPSDMPGQRVLGPIRFEPEPQRFVVDRWGQRIAVFELGSIEGGVTRSVRWEGDFTLFRTRFQILPERVRSDVVAADLRPYLADDKKYDLRSARISKLVAEVTEGKEGTYERARALYEHLARAISYDRSGGWNNATTVLERGSGSCSEYTFALVALLRAAGIPARYVGALSERGDEASFDDVFHRWAEAYLPGYGWVPIDANAAHGEGPAGRGAYFGGRSNRHVVTTRGGGASELLDWTYNSHETYQAEGGATLDVRPIARYRPRTVDRPPQPASAPSVLAPQLTRPQQARRQPETAPAADGASHSWLVGVSLFLALGVGIAVGRLRA